MYQVQIRPKELTRREVAFLSAACPYLTGYHDAPIVKHQQLCTATTPPQVQVRQIRDHFALNTSSDECIPQLAGVRYAFSRLVISTPYKNAWCLLRCLIEILLCFQDPNQRHKRNLHTQLAHKQCLNHRIGPIFDLWSRASVYQQNTAKFGHLSDQTPKKHEGEGYDSTRY